MGIPCLVYAWWFGDNATPRVAMGRGPHTVIFSEEGNYQVALSIDNGCDGDGTIGNNGNGSGSGSGSGSDSGSGSGSGPENGSGSGSGSSVGSGSDSGSRSGSDSSIGSDSVSGNGNNGTGNSARYCIACRKTVTLDVEVDEDCNPDLGSISNFVWNDLDEDGFQDPNEPGIDGVTVQLKTFRGWGNQICDLFEVVYVGGGNNRSAVINSFDAALNHGVVDLTWTNNTGADIDNFEVQKSDETFDFETISITDSKNDNQARTYGSRDANPITGDSYYRLILNRKDGSKEVSPVRKIKISDLEDFGLSPNPAQEYVNVSLKRYHGANIEIGMIDGLGNLLKSAQLENVSDNNYRIELDGVQNGLYHLWIFTEGKRPVGKKVIVNKMY